MAHAPARPAAGAPEAPAPHAARTQAHVAPVYDAATMPAPGVKSVSVDAMPSPANGSQSSSEEVVVPITLSGQGSHEIVLRIVLKIER